MEEFCSSSETVFHQVYEDHTLGQVYDVTDEPATEQVFAFSTASAVPTASAGGMSDNVFTVDTNQPHVTEVRIESDVTCEEPDYKPMYRKLKREFYNAIEANEYVKSELRHCQRVLQSVKEDEYFLLERLLQYGDPPPDSSNSESESDTEATSPGGKQIGDRNPSGVVITSAFSRLRDLTMERKGGSSRKRAKLDNSTEGGDYIEDEENINDDSIDRLDQDIDEPSSPKENGEDSD